MQKLQKPNINCEVIKKLFKKHMRAALVMALFVFGGAHCTSQSPEKAYEKAEKLKDEKQFDKALESYLLAVRREPGTPLSIQAAEKAAQLALVEKKDYALAKELYQHIVIYSQDVNQRITAQKKIAEVTFEKIGDYEAALVELNKLFSAAPELEQDDFYKLKRAKAYNYLKKYFQALTEVEPIIRNTRNKGILLEALLLKADANIYSKNLPTAIEAYKTLLKIFPEQAKKEEVELRLAVAYEELKDFKNAIEMLKQAKASYPNPDFIEKKISFLQERQRQAPGARGFRK